MAVWVQRSVFEGDQSGIGVQKQLVTLSTILRNVDPVLFDHLGREGAGGWGWGWGWGWMWSGVSGSHPQPT